MKKPGIGTQQALEWLANRASDEFIVGLYDDYVHGGGQDKWLNILAETVSKFV